MERYNEYKDSGIFWQPQIPNNWIVKKLGYVLKKHNRPRPLGAELLVCTNKATVIKKGDSKMGMISENEEIYQGVAVGDLLIHGMDTWHGAIAISKYDGMCTPVVHVCTSEEDVAYISYYLRNMATQKVFKLISNGVRQNTSDFRGWDKVKEILCPIPPLSEQQDIAAYLDEATANIDAAIAQQQKMIDLLNERKQIIINNAVTKGLNPNVKMKDSGVDWIGEIPEHWTLCKLKYAFSKVADGTHFSPTTVDEGFPYITAADVRGIGIDYNLTKKISHKDFEQLVSAGCKAEKGDILLVKDGATTGRVGLKIDDVDCVTLSSVAMLTANKNNNNLFLMYMLMSDMMQKQISNSMAGAAMPRITLIKLNNFLVICPSLEEQGIIVSHIEEKIKPINSAIIFAEKQISLLQERKQIIINEVVTGKVKVTK